MPPHEGLDGADVAEVALRDMVIVERGLCTVQNN